MNTLTKTPTVPAQRTGDDDPRLAELEAAYERGKARHAARRAAGIPITPAEIEHVHQLLDLWGISLVPAIGPEATK